MLFCCASLGNLRIDTSNESNLDKNHPEIKAYQAFHDVYGFEEAAVLMVKKDEPFELAFLQKLMRFHNQLENSVEHLDRIKSMASASMIYGDDDDLVVEDLQMSFPQDEQQLAAFKQHVLSNELFTKSFSTSF